MSERFKDFTLLVGSIFIFLVLLEVVMRMFYSIPPPTMDEFNLRKSDYYQKDDELVWVPKKNMRGNHNRSGSFATTFMTNSRGLRDKEYTLNKRGGIKRIVVIGDSYTWGFGVNDNELYTERLEAILPNTEVINLGVTSYAIWQEILYLKREGLQYGPDIVILGFCLNDIVWGNDRLEVSDRKKKAVLKQAIAFNITEFIKKNILYKSSLYQFVIDRVYTSKQLVKALIYLGLRGPLKGFADLNVDLMLSLQNYPDIVGKWWALTEAELLDLKQLASDHGIRFIVAVIPSPLAIDEVRFKHEISQSIFDAKEFDLDKPYRQMENFATANNIEMISPVSVFRQRSKEGISLYINRDIHLNAAGHDLFAQAIAEYLSTRKMQ